MMEQSPFAQVIEFWKPLVGPDEVDGLATFGDLEGLPPRGIRLLPGGGEPALYRIADGDTSFLLFAAVHPIPEPPPGAEIVAAITDLTGEPHSFVLWYPGSGGVVLPFDPGQAVDALRLEQYVPDSRKTVLPPAVLSAYYTVKPLLPSSLRLGLRKLVAGQTAGDGEQPDGAGLSWPSDQSQDLLIRLLLKVLMLARGTDRLSFTWFWPQEHPWAIVLTHDVETAYGQMNVPRIMKIEKARGLRSSFNFVAHAYQIDEVLQARLRDAGFEIGVHGYTHDGRMFANREAFLKRIRAVNECAHRWGAVGFRSPVTYRNLSWLSDFEFEYDSSVLDVARYEPQPGGCASVFPYLIGDMTELPVTVPMDHTLFALLGTTDCELWKAKLAQIRDANGMACMLTHPDPGSGYVGGEKNQARYSEVLDLIADSDAWTPLPRDLVRWWRARADGALAAYDLPEASVGTASLEDDGELRIVAPDQIWAERLAS